jgi:hypothetical protein
MRPLVTLCKGCGEAPIARERKAARPRVTCSPECDRTWKTARARASRSKLRAVDHLELALGALEELDTQPLVITLREFLDRVRNLKPGELAVAPPKPGEALHSVAQILFLRR